MLAQPTFELRKSFEEEVALRKTFACLPSTSCLLLVYRRVDYLCACYVCRLGEKSIRLMRPSLFSTLASDPSLRPRLTSELLQLVAAGVVRPQVHQVYPLSRAAEAQADLTGRRTTGKLLLRPDYLL